MITIITIGITIKITITCRIIIKVILIGNLNPIVIPKIYKYEIKQNKINKTKNKKTNNEQVIK